MAVGDQCKSVSDYDKPWGQNFEKEILNDDDLFNSYNWQDDIDNFYNNETNVCNFQEDNSFNLFSICS